MLEKPAPPNYLPVREDWLALRSEEALEPGLTIVDAHHHLWDRPGWRFMPDDIVRDIAASGHDVVATVFMQCQTAYRSDGPQELRPVGETEFVAGVANKDFAGPFGRIDLCAGIVGHADLRLASRVAAVLDAHIQAGQGRFRGVRHLTTHDFDTSLMNPLSAGPPGLLGDDRFREGFAALAPKGLLFEAWLFHPQLPELTDLARAFPGTTIVLNHAGGMLGSGVYEGRRAEVLRGWSRDITALAACPNVHVKLGGMGMRIGGFGFERGAQPPSSTELAAAWRPYVETCLAAFGVERCLFESNFPVDKGSYNYGLCWNAFKRLTAGMADVERAALFSVNAAALYRLRGLRGVAVGGG